MIISAQIRGMAVKTTVNIFAWEVVLLAVILLPQEAFGSEAYESYRGLYIYGHEARTFTPYGTIDVYWIRADKKIAGHLQRTYKKLATKPYTSPFISRCTGIESARLPTNATFCGLLADCRVYYSAISFEKMTVYNLNIMKL